MCSFHLFQVIITLGFFWKKVIMNRRKQVQLKSRKYMYILEWQVCQPSLGWLDM